MSIDYQNAKYIYIGSAVAVVLILCLIAKSVYKSNKNYSDNEKIAVQTSKGLIKMNAKAVADELAKLQAEMSRHEGYERTSKFDIEINQILDHVKQFIRQNPHDQNVCKGEIKANIMHNALSDRVTPFQTNQHLAHAAILSHDDLEYGTDSLLFDYLLKHIDVLIHMLQRDVCDGGLINIESLENVLRKLDADLSHAQEFDRSNTTNEFTNEYTNEYTNELHSRYDPYMVAKLPMFASQSSQIEGLNVMSQIRGFPSIDDKYYSLGPQNARNAQQRSQMFRENRQKIGLLHYNDEDLLFQPTYEAISL